MTGWPGVSTVTGRPGVSKLTGWPNVSTVTGWPGVSKLTGWPNVSTVTGRPGVSKLTGRLSVWMGTKAPCNPPYPHHSPTPRLLPPLPSRTPEMMWQYMARPQATVQLVVYGSGVWPDSLSEWLVDGAGLQ